MNINNDKVEIKLDDKEITESLDLSTVIDKEDKLKPMGSNETTISLIKIEKELSSEKVTNREIECTNILERQNEPEVTESTSTVEKIMIENVSESSKEILDVEIISKNIEDVEVEIKSDTNLTGNQSEAIIQNISHDEGSPMDVDESNYKKVENSEFLHSHDEPTNVDDDECDDENLKLHISYEETSPMDVDEADDNELEKEKKVDVTSSESKETTIDTDILSYNTSTIIAAEETVSQTPYLLSPLHKIGSTDQTKSSTGVSEDNTALPPIQEQTDEINVNSSRIIDIQLFSSDNDTNTLNDTNNSQGGDVHMTSDLYNLRKCGSQNSLASNLQSDNSPTSALMELAEIACRKELDDSRSETSFNKDEDCTVELNQVVGDGRSAASIFDISQDSLIDTNEDVRVDDTIVDNSRVVTCKDIIISRSLVVADSGGVDNISSDTSQIDTAAREGSSIVDTSHVVANVGGKDSTINSNQINRDILIDKNQVPENNLVDEKQDKDRLDDGKQDNEAMKSNLSADNVPFSGPSSRTQEIDQLCKTTEVSPDKNSESLVNIKFMTSNSINQFESDINISAAKCIKAAANEEPNLSENSATLFQKTVGFEEKVLSGENIERIFKKKTNSTSIMDIGKENSTVLDTCVTVKSEHVDIYDITDSVVLFKNQENFEPLKKDFSLNSETDWDEVDLDIKEENKSVSDLEPESDLISIRSVHDECHDSIHEYFRLVKVNLRKIDDILANDTIRAGIISSELDKFDSGLQHYYKNLYTQIEHIDRRDENYRRFIYCYELILIAYISYEGDTKSYNAENISGILSKLINARTDKVLFILENDQLLEYIEKLADTQLEKGIDAWEELWDTCELYSGRITKDNRKPILVRNYLAIFSEMVRTHENDESKCFLTESWKGLSNIESCIHDVCTFRVKLYSLYLKYAFELPNKDKLQFLLNLRLCTGEQRKMSNVGLNLLPPDNEADLQDILKHYEKINKSGVEISAIGITSQKILVRESDRCQRDILSRVEEKGLRDILLDYAKNINKKGFKRSVEERSELQSLSKYIKQVKKGNELSRLRKIVSKLIEEDINRTKIHKVIELIYKDIYRISVPSSSEIDLVLNETM